MVSLSASPTALSAPYTPPVAKVTQLDAPLTTESLSPASVTSASDNPSFDTTWMPTNQATLPPPPQTEVALMPALPQQYFPPNQAQQWQAMPEPKPYGYSTNIGVQRYMPLQPRRELNQEEQMSVSQGLQRWLPARLAPSNLTPLPSLLANPTKYALIVGGILGAFSAITTYASARFSALPHGSATGWGLLAGAVLGGIGTVSSYFSRRAYNENVVDTMMRMPPGATYRDMKADPVYQAELDRAAMRSSGGGSGDLASALLLGSMMSWSRGGTSHHYYGSNSGPTSRS
jgi:hypothetical protein